MSRKKRQRSKQFRASRPRKKTRKLGQKSIGQVVAGWFSQHRPVFVFLLIFGVLMGLFYAFTIFTPFYRKHLFPSYVRMNARLAGAVLAFLSQDITVADASIFSPGFSISVGRGCDAIEPNALFVCAVLAFPAPFLRKITGIIAGTLFLSIFNFARIVGLFLIGVYLPKAFPIMHLDVLEGLFILFAIIFWILWLLWATQSQISTQRVSS